MEGRDLNVGQIEAERHYKRFLHCGKCGNREPSEILISKKHQKLRCKACGRAEFRDLLPVNRK